MGLWDFLITALLFISVIGNNIPQEMVLIPILLTYMVYAKVWFQVVTYSLHILVAYMGDKYSKLHHFADDSSLNFSSSIKLINKQANDNFKVNSLA